MRAIRSEARPSPYGFTALAEFRDGLGRSQRSSTALTIASRSDRPAARFPRPGPRAARSRRAGPGPACPKPGPLPEPLRSRSGSGTRVASGPRTPDSPPGRSGGFGGGRRAGRRRSREPWDWDAPGRRRSTRACGRSGRAAPANRRQGGAEVLAAMGRHEQESVGRRRQGWCGVVPAVMTEGVDDGVARDVDRRRINSLVQEIAPAEAVGAKCRAARCPARTRFFSSGKGRYGRPVPQARLDMAEWDLVVIAGQGGAKDRGRVALAQDQLRVARARKTAERAIRARAVRSARP